MNSSTLKQKYGPLQLWQWALVVAVILVGGFYLYRKRQSSGNSTSNTDNVGGSGNTSTDSGSGGSGGLALPPTDPNSNSTNPDTNVGDSTDLSSVWQAIGDTSAKLNDILNSQNPTGLGAGSYGN